jgi:hypothetical protein
MTETGRSGPDPESLSQIADFLVKQSRGGLLHKVDTWCQFLGAFNDKFTLDDKPAGSSCTRANLLLGKVIQRLRRLRDSSTNTKDDAGADTSPPIILAATRASKTIHSVICAACTLGWVDTSLYNEQRTNWKNLLDDALLGGHLELADKVYEEALFESMCAFRDNQRDVDALRADILSPRDKFVKRLRERIVLLGAQKEKYTSKVLSSWQVMIEQYAS